MSAEIPLEIDVETVKQWLVQKADFVLLDCREPGEAEVARIESSILVPMSQWADRAEELAGLNDRHVVVYCHHGGRSLRVVHWMRANGITQSQSMSGGIDAWSIQIDPTLPRY